MGRALFKQKYFEVFGFIHTQTQTDICTCRNARQCLWGFVIPREARGNLKRFIYIIHIYLYLYIYIYIHTYSQTQTDIYTITHIRLKKFPCSVQILGGFQARLERKTNYPRLILLRNWWLSSNKIIAFFYVPEKYWTYCPHLYRKNIVASAFYFDDNRKPICNLQPIIIFIVFILGLERSNYKTLVNMHVHMFSKRILLLFWWRSNIIWEISMCINQCSKERNINIIILLCWDDLR